MFKCNYVIQKETTMKQLTAIALALFATASFASEPAKKAEAPKAAASAPAKKAEPAKAAAPAPAKKEEPAKK